MFTTEIRINGMLVLHIYGRNTAVCKDGKSQYIIELYKTETSEITTFNIYHRRSEGISKLIELILSEYNQLKK